MRLQILETWRPPDCPVPRQITREVWSLALGVWACEKPLTIIMSVSGWRDIRMHVRDFTDWIDRSVLVSLEVMRRTGVLQGSYGCISRGAYEISHTSTESLLVATGLRSGLLWRYPVHMTV